MEQTIAKRPFPNDQQINRRQTWHKGTVGTSGATYLEDPSQTWYPRRQTGWKRTHISSGNYGGDVLTQDKGQRTVCNDGFKFYGNENLGDVPNSKTPPFGRGNAYDDSRTISPCRKFQSGRCHRGATCPYLHSENTIYAKPRYDWSTQLQQGVARTPRDPGFGKRNIGNTIEIPQGHYETNNVSPYLHPEHTAYVRPRYDWSTQHHRRAAATSFAKGSIGDSLRTSQEYGEENKDYGLRIRSFPREPRTRPPCRKFLSGKCLRGATCPYLHPVLYDGPRYSSAQQHQGLAGTSNEPLFGEGDMDIAHDKFKSHGMQLPQNTHVESNLSFNHMNHENMDITSRSRSSERQRSRPLGGCGGDKLKLEVCLKFSRGRCDRGESCKYLHDFHEFSRSVPDWSKQPHLEATAALRNFGGSHQYVPSMVCQEHDHAVKQKKLDHKGETLVMDQQECGFSGGAIASNCDFAEAHDDIRPFKRQRSKSRSPFIPRDDFGRRSIRKDAFQNNLPRYSPCNNVVPFQYPYRRSYQYNKRRCHMNLSHSKVAATSMESCSLEINEDSNLMETNGHDKVRSHGMQLDQSANLSTEILNQKSEAELAKGAAQPSHVEKENKESEVAASSEDPCSHEVNKGSDFTETQGYDKVISHGMQLNQCLGGSLDSNTAILSQKSEAEWAKGDLETSYVKQDGEGLVTGSSETDIPKGPNAINPVVIAPDSRSSCEKNHISPMDTDVSVSNNDINAEVNIDLGKEGSEKTEALTIHPRKRRKKRHSKCRAEPMKEEVTDPAIQGLSCSSAGETSLSHPDIVSVAGVSDDMKSASKNSSVENELTVDHPVQQLEQEVGAIANKIQNNVKPAQAVMADGTMLGGDSDSHSMQTRDSSLIPAILKSKRNLLILDLNGLLADIVADVPDGYTPDTVVSKKAVFKRRFCNDFLGFCFERFDVGVWSSRAKKNVTRVVDFLMGNTKERLLFCWDQSHCTGTGFKTIENRDKPLVLKELKKLWEKQVADLPWEKGYYNETNTVLLDDSPYKALRNPPYTAVFPYPYTFEDLKDESLGPGGDIRVYLERLATANNVQKFIQENPFGQKPITESNWYWGFYSKIVGAYAKKKNRKAKKAPAASQHPPRS